MKVYKDGLEIKTVSLLEIVFVLVAGLLLLASVVKWLAS